MSRSTVFAASAIAASLVFSVAAKSDPLPAPQSEETLERAVVGALNTTLDYDLRRSTQPLATTHGESALQTEAKKLLVAGRYEEARVVCERGLAGAEEKDGRESLAASWWLNQLALVLTEQARYAEAEALFKRAIAIRERLFGPEDALTLTSVYNLALLYHTMGRYAEAEPLFARVVSTTAKIVGPDHWVTATFASGLAELYKSQGRLAEAEDLMRRNLAAFERKWGPDHTATAIALNNLASLLHVQGRLGEAEPLMRRALAIAERQLGSDHPTVATFLLGLGSLLGDRQNFAEAEALSLRALELRERKLGAMHPDTAAALNNLALLYGTQKLYDLAAAAINRALGIVEKSLGPEHPNTVTILVNAAVVDEATAKFAQAEARYKQALAAAERHPERDPAIVPPILIGLGKLYLDQGEPTEAEAFLSRALKTHEALDSNPRFAAAVFHLLARASYDRDALADAEAHARRALDLLREIWPPGHPELGVGYYWLSLIELKRGALRNAFEASDEAVAILSAHASETALEKLQGSRRGVGRYDGAFAHHLRVAYALAAADPASAAALRESAFKAAQLMSFDETAQAVSRMAARFAAGSDALAALLREQQALLQRLAALDKLTANAIGSSDPKSRAQVDVFRKQDVAVRARLKEVDAMLRRDHKAYADLAVPRPMTIGEAQALLSGDEAIALMLAGAEDCFPFALSNSQIAWSRAPVRGEALSETVAALRGRLDPDRWRQPLEPFDRALAHSLYRDLWPPLEGVLKDKRQVFIVATGSLTSLPLGVLVTGEPQGGAAGDADPQALRDTPWLIKRHALVTLPSLSSLRALRLAANKPSASEPFAGFGDPVLGAAPAKSARGASVASVFRGGAVDRTQLSALPELPETARELRALAKTLGASETKDVHLRERATEAQIKSLDLSRKRVVAFATHALTAGDLGLGEPGLVFTPPARASERDDGYLTASEAALLNLSADWIILSACNTAAGDQPGAKGLSGLARAFFLAGARSLLVSHWAMWDDAAERLTTASVKNFQANPRAGRGEALRQAMLALMNDASAPRFAHPAAWAPFILAGETRAN